MAGGIVVSPQVGAELAVIGAITVVGALVSQANAAASPPKPYRPPQWNQPAVTSITVPASQQATSDASSGTLSMTAVAASYFVFDGVMHVGHAISLRAAKFPVQTGANSTYNIVRNPYRLRLEVQMSDSMDSYASGMWTGNSSKSVAAFQAMVKIAEGRQLVTVATRLKTYTNMMILNVDSDDSNTTAHGLRMILTLEEQITVTVATVQLSARPSATDSTSLATKQATNPTGAAIANNALPSPIYPSVNLQTLSSALGTTIGAGSWDSNATSLLLGGQNP
jgi:hypothetical protein